MFSHEGQKRTSSQMKSRSTHILGCHFPLPLPALLRGKLELESQVTDSILLEQESNASRVSLLPYSACTGVGVVGGAKKCQAGSTSQLDRRRRLVLTLCQTGRRLWQASPELAHAPTAGLVLRNATLSCSAAREKFCATVPPCSLSYLQCRCALC